MKITKKMLSIVLALTMILSFFGFQNLDFDQQVNAASPASEIELLAKGSQWKYLDNGSDQGTTWKSEVFDDSTWSTGNGPLGYSDPVTTTVNYGSDSHNKFITTYFRTTFTVTDINDITSLNGYMRYDDGAVVYINGEEVARPNMLPGEILYTTFAGPSDHEGTDYESFSINPQFIHNGINSVAVEIHQINASSSDLMFDLNLIANEQTQDNESYSVSDLCLTPGANSSEMRFAWYSTGNSSNCVLQGALKEDMTGTEFPENDSMTFQGTTRPAVNGYTSNYVTVSGLPENMDFVYRVGDGQGNWSEIYNFSTKDTSDYGFLVAGDPQIGSKNTDSDTQGWIDTLNKSINMFPDTSFLLSVGDQVNTSNNESQYNGFFAPEQFRSLPIATVIGNHDSSAPNYTYHFNNPNVTNYGTTTAGSGYYYTYGNTLFIMINSNSLNNADQEALIQEAINANPNCKWRIISFHHSIYSAASHIDDGDIEQRRNQMPQYIDKYDIDVVLMGHDHSYTRSYQMLANMPQKDQNIDSKGRVVNPTGTLYLTTNSASGSKYYALKNPETSSIYGAVVDQSNVPNITYVNVSETTLSLTTYETDDMDVLDTYTIVKTSDKEDLNNAIISAQNKVESNYTKQSWSVLAQALSEARIISEDVEATQTEVSTATSKLNNAMSNLVINPNTSLLEKTISDASTLYNNTMEGSEPGQYTKESRSQFKSVIDNARTVLTNASSQSSVDSAVSTIKEAITTYNNSIITLKDIIQKSPEGTVDIQGKNNSVTLSKDELKAANENKVNLKLIMDNATISLPCGSLDTDADAVEITMDNITNNHISNYFTVAGQAFQLNLKADGTIIHNFNGKVQVTIQLTVDDIKNIDVTKLSAYYYNDQTKEWENLGGIYDSDAMTFTFETDHFSEFAIMAQSDNTQNPEDGNNDDNNSNNDNDTNTDTNPNNNSPETGDHFMLLPYIVIIIMCFIAVFIFIRTKKTKNIAQ